MPVLVSYHFRMAGTGKRSFAWTEAHYHVAAGDIPAAKDDAIQLSNARLNLCGSNVELTHIRLAVHGQPRKNLEIPGGTNQIPSNLKFSPDPWAVTPEDFRLADHPNACIQCRVKDDVGRAKSFYLAGLPDLLLRTKPTGPDFDSLPGSGTRFGLWRGFLTNESVNRWGMYVRKLNAGIDIRKWTQWVDDPTLWVVWINTAEDINVPEGKEIQVTKARPKGPDAAPPNGIFVVEKKLADAPNALTGYVLRGSQGIMGELLTKKRGQVIKVEYEFSYYRELAYASQTTRKRGGRGGAARGRS